MWNQERAGREPALFLGSQNQNHRDSSICAGTKAAKSYTPEACSAPERTQGSQNKTQGKAPANTPSPIRATCSVHVTPGTKRGRCKVQLPHYGKSGRGWLGGMGGGVDGTPPCGTPVPFDYRTQCSHIEHHPTRATGTDHVTCWRNSSNINGVHRLRKPKRAPIGAEGWGVRALRPSVGTGVPPCPHEFDFEVS